MGQVNGKEKGDGGSQSVDGGALVPQGVYSGAQDYDHGVVKSLIHGRKMAPFYPGLDDEESYAQAPFNTECPICFLYYPSPLNITRCCGQPICTECFVQIKRADPNHSNPPSSEPAMCPYCQETDFGMVYRAPPPGVLTGEIKSAAGVAESASAAREQAEGIAEGSQQHKKRKSFSATDPSVVTTDMIRPDWQAKLLAAEAVTQRRANRRIIMRQVGDRLIPIGVSSSRLGAELPPGSTTGPGGAIILGENSRWGSERRGSRGRRGGELAHFLQSLGGGPDMEEMMMMEAMRLSLLEHEEQQRRQAQEQSRSGQEAAGATGGTPAGDAGNMQGATAAASHGATNNIETVSLPQQRSSSLAADTDQVAPSISPPTRTPANPQDLGISLSMMAELSELIEGGLSLPSSPPGINAVDAAAGDAAGSSPTSAPIVSNPVSIPSAIPITAVSTPPSQFHSPAQSPTHTPTFGTPTRIGMNPNNPFRRNVGSSTNSPVHSRQPSLAPFGQHQPGSGLGSGPHTPH